MQKRKALGFLYRALMTCLDASPQTTAKLLRRKLNAAKEQVVFRDLWGQPVSVSAFQQALARGKLFVDKAPGPLAEALRDQGNLLVRSPDVDSPSGPGEGGSGNATCQE